ncbi:MAG: spondin domain-containing protein [Gemmatimonadaceae bacterium]
MTVARFRTIALASLALAGTAGAQQPMQDKMMKDDKGMMMHETVTYTVVLKGRWTAANFPHEYPAGAHFSGLIGATHSEGYALFSEGAMPSAGLERLSETGRHMPLDAEIRAAIATGRAGKLVESGPLKDFGDSVVTTITVDAKFPLVSLVAMIAPSPDWFAGVASVDLRDMGSWATSRTVELVAYDSGGDDGTTYTAPDKDTAPKRATMLATSRHFAPNGKALPVATVTFVRK